MAFIIGKAIGMAKRKATHWAVRRKNKQARAGDNGDDGDKDKPDRRESFPEVIHPGSYAAARARQQPPATPVDVSGATKRRYGLWLAFCGKNYSGMQMYAESGGYGCHFEPLAAF